MSQAQIGFLVLVFVATFAVAIWLLGRTAGGATSQRLSRVLGRADSESSAAAEGWVDRVARATKPLAKLSVPDAGYESSALRRRFFNAGVRSPTAPMAFFGFPMAANIDMIAPRPIMLVAGANAHSRYYSEDVYKAASNAKELLIVPDADHVDLYDDLKKIPFDRLAAFFKENLT